MLGDTRIDPEMHTPGICTILVYILYQSIKKKMEKMKSRAYLRVLNR